MKRLLTIFILLNSIALSHDNEIHKNWSYNLMVGPSYNIHTASFKELPGYSYCCGELNDGFGIGYFASFGLQYFPEKKSFGFISSYQFDLLLRDMSGDLIKDTLIGNRISEFDYQIIDAKHIQESNILGLAFRPSFNISLLNHLDLNIGAQLSFPIIGSFNYFEQANGDFKFANGSDTVNTQSGYIPDLNPMMISPSVALAYSTRLSDNMDMNFDLRYDHMLTNVVSDIDWKVNSISFGLGLRFNNNRSSIPKPPSPPDPVMPDVPTPPEEIALDFKLDLFANSQLISDNDTLAIKLNSIVDVEEYSILPLLFYQIGSVELIPTPKSESIEYIGQEMLLEPIVEHLRSNQNSSLLIKSISSSDENIVDQRIEEIISSLVRSGVDKDRLKVDKLFVKISSDKYDELNEENEKIEFEFSDKTDLVRFRFNEKREYSIKDLLSISAKVDPNKKDFTSELTLVVAGNKVAINTNDSLTQLIDEKILEVKPGLVDLSIEASVRSREEKKNKYKSVYLDLLVDDEKEVINEFSDGKGSGSLMILGYFDFDQDNFKAIDYEVLNRVKDALKKGFKVEILALTDNLGSQEHNKRLSKRRAVAARKLINTKGELVSSTPEKEYFSNDHPYGRTLNRSVLVKIYK